MISKPSEEIMMLRTNYYLVEQDDYDTLFTFTDCEADYMFSVDITRLEDLHFILSVLLGKEVK